MSWLLIGVEHIFRCPTSFQKIFGPTAPVPPHQSHLVEIAQFLSHWFSDFAEESTSLNLQAITNKQVTKESIRAQKITIIKPEDLISQLHQLTPVWYTQHHFILREQSNTQSSDSDESNPKPSWSTYNGSNWSQFHFNPKRAINTVNAYVCIVGFVSVSRES